MSGMCGLGHERTCLVYLDVRFTPKAGIRGDCWNVR
jgi:hypothetical protein